MAEGNPSSLSLSLSLSPLSLSGCKYGNFFLAKGNIMPSSVCHISLVVVWHDTFSNSAHLLEPARSQSEGPPKTWTPGQHAKRSPYQHTRRSRERLLA